MTPSGWENKRNQDPNVICSKDTFHMWYSGGEIFAWQIGYANSENGVYWIKHPEPVLTPGPTGIYNIRNQVGPSEFELFQNYPNPFNPITTIEYNLPKQSQVELGIYNILGQKMATLVSEKQQAGSYKLEWDASEFSSGIYMCQIKAKSKKQTAVFAKKLVLLK
jgi:hypothetical protein